jgi:hypothetical protein
LTIVGLYSANSRAGDSAKLSLTAQTLVGQLVPPGATRLVLLLDDSKLAATDQFAFLVRLRRRRPSSSPQTLTPPTQRCAEKGEEWRSSNDGGNNASDIAAVRQRSTHTPVFAVSPADSCHTVRATVPIEHRGGRQGVRL